MLPVVDYLFLFKAVLTTFKNELASKANPNMPAVMTVCTVLFSLSLVCTH